MKPENRYYLRTHGNHPVEQLTTLQTSPLATAPVPTTTTAVMDQSFSSSIASSPAPASPSVARSSSSSSTTMSTSTRPTPFLLAASSPRHQLEAFSGINQDPKRWLSWYDRYCAYYKLTHESDKMADFPFHLTEHARAWYDGITVPPTFALLRQMFEARFQPTNSMDFMTIKQAPSESVQDYFLRLCKCKPHCLTEEWVKGIAIRGLRDDLRTIVMPQNPTTLEATRRASLLAEETLNMSSTASVATFYQSQFESVVLEQLAQLKLELDQMRKSQQTNSGPDRRNYQPSGNGYQHRKGRRQPQNYQQPQQYHAERYQNQQPPSYHQKGTRISSRGTSGTQIPREDSTMAMKVEDSRKDKLQTISVTVPCKKTNRESRLGDFYYRTIKQEKEEETINTLPYQQDIHWKDRTENKQRERLISQASPVIKRQTEHFFSAKGDLIEDVIETIKGNYLSIDKTSPAKGIEVVKTEADEILVQIGEIAYPVDPYDMAFESSECKDTPTELYSMQGNLRSNDDRYSWASLSPESSHGSECETGPQYLERTDVTYSMETNFDAYECMDQGQGQCHSHRESYDGYSYNASKTKTSSNWIERMSEGHSRPLKPEVPMASQTKTSMTYANETFEVLNRSDSYIFQENPIVDSLIRSHTEISEKSTNVRMQSHFYDNSPQNVTMTTLSQYSDRYLNMSPASLQYETLKTESDYHCVTNKNMASPNYSEQSECDDVSMATGEESGWETSYAYGYGEAEFSQQYPPTIPSIVAYTPRNVDVHTENTPTVETSHYSIGSNQRTGQSNKNRYATSSSSVKKLKRGCRLWEFIRNLLLDPSTNPTMIRWENRDKGTFKLVQSKAIAHIWGMKKGNEGMNYEKLSRAMRYYYKRQIFAPVLGKRLVYSFGPRATGWRIDEIVA